jgi:hypothetical protein
MDYNVGTLAPPRAWVVGSLEREGVKDEQETGQQNKGDLG